jgi:hypothetical protein
MTDVNEAFPGDPETMNNNMTLKKFFHLYLVRTAIASIYTVANAQPVVIDPYVTLSVFDSGGALTRGSNGGFTLGGLEVDPLGNGVFVIAGDSNIFDITASLQLIHSTGMGSSATVGMPEPISLIPWAYDLTRGADGRYYVAGALSGVGGVYGFDPVGESPVNAFITGTPTWATSGLTLDVTGAIALISTDGSSSTSSNGLYQITSDGVVTKLINPGELPHGIPHGTDDHVMTLDGRIILAGDKSHELWDVTAGPGSVTLLADLDAYFSQGEVPGWGINDNVWGSRATVDPVSGDIFYSHGAAVPTTTPMSIIRVTADGSTASLFATGFSVLRDLDFGPSSHGEGRSLYVTEFSGGVGTIYELAFAEPDILGRPVYQPGAGEGLYLWKETFDGPYHMEISGSGPLTQFSFELIADKPIDSVMPRQLETNDTLVWNGHHLAFNGWVTNWVDALDFRLPPGTTAMIAIEQDGTPSPSQLHIGASGLPLSPNGWIAEADTLPVTPPFQGGQDLGLFIGRDAASGEVHIRCNGDGSNHHAEINLLFSRSPGAVTPVGLEINDVLVAAGDNSLSIDSYVGSWWDGVNIDLLPATRVGFAYRQDGLIQSDWVNPKTHDLGTPNAYQLPQVNPYGKPLYNPATEAGLYLWQDKATGAWHLRGAAGGSSGRYSGEIVSDQPFTSVSAVSLEANDLLDASDPKRIVFDLAMWSQWEDGIDYQVPSGAQLSLDLTTGYPFASPAEAVRVGILKWPVGSLPLDLSGW